MRNKIRLSITDSRILSGEKTGKKWEVMAIKAGMSHNRCPEGYPYYYSPENLKAALPLFENLDVCAFELDKDYFNHVPEGSLAEKVKLGPGLVKNTVGRYNGVRWGSDNDGNEGIVGLSTLVDDVLATRLRNAWEMGFHDFVEYSIDGDGEYDITNVNGQKVASVKIIDLDSLDMATAGAAGGKNIRLVAAIDKKNEERRMKANLRATIFRLLESRKAEQTRANRILEADDANATTVAVEELQKEIDAMQKAGLDKAVALIKEAIAALQAGKAEDALVSLQKALEAQPPEPDKSADRKPDTNDKPPTPASSVAPKPADKPKEPDGANGGSSGTPEQVQNLKTEVENLKAELDQDKAVAEIEASNLPEASKEHLKESVRGRTLARGRIREAIASEQKYIERLGVGNVGGLQLTERGRSDAIIALEGFFYNNDLLDDAKRPVRRFHSIREAKIKAWGGDPEESAEAFLGSLCVPYHSGERNRRRMRESIVSTTFDSAFADVMHKVMLNDYNLPEGNEWRKIVEIGSVNDFRDHNFTRIGYFGDLHDVDPDGGTYQDMDNFTDEGVAVNVSTKGGMVSITRKTIVNDDMRVIRLIPFRLSRAAKGGIRRSVFNVFTANSGAGLTCAYDGKTLIHTDHGNGASSGGTTLNPTTLNACRVAMMRQRAFGDKDEAPEYLGESNLPKWLLIPPEQETMAISLCKATNLIQVVTSAAGGFANGQILPNNPALNIHSQSGVDYIMIPEWTDTASWRAVADPMNTPCIIVAFLKGQEEPELEQEAAGTGSNFTARKVTYRVSHDRGIKVIDHRGAYGQKV